MPAAAICFYCKDIELKYDRSLRFTNMSIGIYKCPNCNREYAK